MESFGGLYVTTDIVRAEGYAVGASKFIEQQTTLRLDARPVILEVIPAPEAQISLDEDHIEWPSYCLSGSGLRPDSELVEALYGAHLFEGFMPQLKSVEKDIDKLGFFEGSRGVNWYWESLPDVCGLLDQGILDPYGGRLYDFYKNKLQTITLNFRVVGEFDVVLFEKLFWEPSY